MKTFAESLRETRRLTILRSLAEIAAYRMNSSVMYTSLHFLGITCSRDDVLTDLAWLQEQSLVILEEPADKVYVATLTARGKDVAEGVAYCPGVARPSPR